MIHWLHQRRGVGRKKDELDVQVQVLQHVGVGRSIIEDHQDTEGEAMRHATHIQLVHQDSLAVRLENVSRHPTTGTGEPMDRQAAFVIAQVHKDCWRGTP